MISGLRRVILTHPPLMINDRGEWVRSQPVKSPFSRWGVWVAAFNDLILVVRRWGSLYVKTSRLLSLVPEDEMWRCRRLGALLKYLYELGLARRLGSPRHPLYQLIPENLWRRFIDICGPRPPEERYKCEGCPFAHRCPFVMAVAVVVKE